MYSIIRYCFAANKERQTRTNTESKTAVLDRGSRTKKKESLSSLEDVEGKDVPDRFESIDSPCARVTTAIPKQNLGVLLRSFHEYHTGGCDAPRKEQATLEVTRQARRTWRR